jgi:hypothetical protein
LNEQQKYKCVATTSNNLEQADTKEGKKQLAPLDIKQKGCTCTNKVGEDPKGKL